MMVVFGQSEYMSLDNDVTMVLARNRISAAPCSAFSFEKLYAIYSLDECLLLCEVSQKSIRGFSRYLEIFIKRYKLCMPWSLHFMQTNLLLFGCFRKVFITHSISEGNQTRYILPCCMEIWCCAKLGTIGNPRTKKLPNLTSLQYLLTFAPMLNNF